MKTTTLLLSLTCLSLFNISAVASSTTDETETVKLPAYVVAEPRQTPAEKEIKRNLDALRAIASKPIPMKIALPLPAVKTIRVPMDPKTSSKSGAIMAGL